MWLSSGPARTETLYCLWRLAYGTTNVQRAFAVLKYAISLQNLRPLPPHKDIAWHDLLARFCQPLIGFGHNRTEHGRFLAQHIDDVVDVMYMVGAAIERSTESRLQEQHEVEGEY